MIKKYTDFLTEKLTDNLIGSTEEETMNYLKTLDVPKIILEKSIKLKFKRGIDYALDNNAEVTDQNIFDAIDDNNIDIAKYLIHYLGNLYNRKSLLEKIIKIKNKELLQTLFDVGFKMTFLYVDVVAKLATTNDVSLMNIILDSDIDFKKYGDEILSKALLYPHINMIKLLLKYEFNVNPSVYNPILNACYDNKKFKIIINLLIDAGLDKYEYIDNALTTVVYNGWIEQTKYLVELGADIKNFKDINYIKQNEKEMRELIEQLKKS